MVELNKAHTLKPSQGLTDAWLHKIEYAIGGQMLMGGTRVAIREVLEQAFQYGLETGEQGGDATRITAGMITTDKIYTGVDVENLQQWWQGIAASEISGLTAKMVEYGGLSRATDLTEIGRHMTELGVPVREVEIHGEGEEEAWLQELGIYFYLVGKFARWSAAIQEARHVSDDTLHDIGIYVRMAQRVRAVGGWPK